MPEITAQSADGRLHVFPEGTPQDVVDRAMHKYTAELNESRGTVLGETAKAAVRGPVGGILGLFEGGAGPQGERNPLLQFLRPDLAREVSESGSLSEQTIRALGVQQDKRASTPARYAGTATEFATNPVSYAGGGGAAGKAVNAIASGLGSETAGQLTEGTSAEPYARIAGAVAGGQVPRAVARAGAGMTVPAEREAALDTLRQEGVAPTAGQATGSKALSRAEGSLGEALGAGGAGSREYLRVAREYTRAALRRIGENAEFATPEVLTRARDRISNVFESVAQRLPITMDRRMSDEVSTMVADLQREGLPPDTVNRIVAQVDNVMGGFVSQNNGRTVMDGRTYQALTRKNTPLARAIDDNDPNVAYYATRLRSALDDAMERSAMGRGTRAGVGRRQALDELREARRQWYNSIVLSRAVSGAGEGAGEGLVSPQKLRAVLTGGSTDKQIEYALGRGGGLQDIARAGNVIMTPLPNSNTAERTFLHTVPATVGGALGHILTGSPVEGSLAGMTAGAAAPGVTGRTLMSQPVQRYLMGELPGQAAAGEALEALPGPGSSAIRSAIGEAIRPPGQEDDRLPPNSQPRAGTGTPGGVALPGFVHEAEKPNTARGVLENVRQFIDGGLYEVLKARGVQMPAWVDKLAAFLKRDDLNAALGVVGGPGTGKIMQMYKAGSSLQEIAKATDRPLADVSRTIVQQLRPAQEAEKKLSSRVIQTDRDRAARALDRPGSIGHPGPKRQLPDIAEEIKFTDNADRNAKIVGLAEKGYSYEQIAAAMKLPRNAVAGVLNRARKGRYGEEITESAGNAAQKYRDERFTSRINLLKKIQSMGQ